MGGRSGRCGPRCPPGRARPGSAGLAGCRVHPSRRDRRGRGRPRGGGGAGPRRGAPPPRRRARPGPPARPAPVAAAAIAASLVPRAPGMTTSELRRKLRQKIASFDPQAAKRRKEKAEKDARVESWVESDGTGAIAGRGMNLAKMIAADQQVDADARWLQANGAPGTLDQLRVEVFLTRLCGQPLYTLLPEPSTGTGAGNGTAGTRASAASASTGGAGTASAADAGALGGGLGGSVNLTMPAGTWLGVSDAPGEASGYGTIDARPFRDLPAPPVAPRRPTRWCITPARRHTRARAPRGARA